MISFQNPGLIDPRCITTIGVSVKESENPIGYFGTGLKYAIAIILRHGGSITIWRGTEAICFDPKPVEIRGKTVNVITMNGAELGFTTDLGKTWEIWQCFREIYSNMLDEKGRAEKGSIPPAADFTTIHVELDAFETEYEQRDRVFLATTPVYAAAGVAFHPGGGHDIYYRGVRVARVADHYTFTPNILQRIELTEDRTIKHGHEIDWAMAKAILQTDDAAFAEKIITAHEKSAEGKMDLDRSYIEPSPAFLEATRTVAADTSRHLNPTAKKVMTRHEPPPQPVEAELLDHERAQLRKAITFCKELGYPVDDYPLTIVDSLGVGVLGKAEREPPMMFMARRCFGMGDQTVAATLIEEWAHIKHAFADYTPDFQNWIFEQLIAKGEAYLFEKRAREAEAPVARVAA
jgi:hypothetical protein